MTLRFLVDESTGRAVAHFLQSAGHDTVYVGDSMLQADDERILARAVADSRIIVTNDKDFGDIVFRDQRPHCGVLLLRLSDHRPETKIRVVRLALEVCGDRLANRFAVATEQAIRIRRPLAQ